MIDPPPWSDDDILETPPSLIRARTLLTKLSAPISKFLSDRRERRLRNHVAYLATLHRALRITLAHNKFPIDPPPPIEPPNDAPQQP